jgi:hypothetical protein
MIEEENPLLRQKVSKGYLDKAYILSLIDTIILIAFTSILVYLVKWKKLQTDKMAKLIITLFIIALFLSDLMWIFDFTIYDNGTPYFILFELIDFVSAYVGTLSIYLFVF